ncbi:hypothetical protein XENOCAPTIV_019787, partial [Xenoophorus captivus]
MSRGIFRVNKTSSMYRMEDERQCKVLDKPGEKRINQTEQQRLSKQPLWSRWKNMSGIIVCVSMCVLCLGLCFFVIMRTLELQSRLQSLEQQQDAKFSAWMMTLEQVEPFIMGRVDQLLAE